MTKVKHMTAAGTSENDGEKLDALAPVKFNYRGDDLDVVSTPDGEHWVVLARLCEPLGLQDHPQVDKLRALPWATTRMIRTVAADGKSREIVCLSLRSVAGWLFTINAGKVRPELREKLAVYQRECADVLADHFLGKRGAVYPPAPALTAEQIAMIAAAAAAATVREILDARARDHARYDIIGGSGARDIKAKLKRYASVMARGVKSAYRSWRSTADMELRTRIGHYGAASTWESLRMERFSDAQRHLEEMIRRAEKTYPPQASLFVVRSGQ